MQSNGVKALISWLVCTGTIPPRIQHAAVVVQVKFLELVNFVCAVMSKYGEASKIGRTEGLAALYKGFQPKALRMGIGGAVAVTAFEAVCEIANSL